MGKQISLPPVGSSGEEGADDANEGPNAGDNDWCHPLGYHFAGSRIDAKCFGQIKNKKVDKAITELFLEQRISHDGHVPCSSGTMRDYRLIPMARNGHPGPPSLAYFSLINLCMPITIITRIIL